MSARSLSLAGPTWFRKKAKSKRRARVQSTEYNLLLTATLCLLALGAVMVFSASSTTKVLSDGGLSDSAYYLKRTLLFGAVGLVFMHIAARHGLTAIRRLTPAILAISFFLLLAVLVAGSHDGVACAYRGFEGELHAAAGEGIGRQQRVADRKPSVSGRRRPLATPRITRRQ